MSVIFTIQDANNLKKVTDRCYNQLKMSFSTYLCHSQSLKSCFLWRCIPKEIANEDVGFWIIIYPSHTFSQWAREHELLEFMAGGQTCPISLLRGPVILLCTSVIKDPSTHPFKNNTSILLSSILQLKERHYHFIVIVLFYLNSWRLVNSSCKVPL